MNTSIPALRPNGMTMFRCVAWCGKVLAMQYLGGAAVDARAELKCNVLFTVRGIGGHVSMHPYRTAYLHNPRPDNPRPDIANHAAKCANHYHPPHTTSGVTTHNPTRRHHTRRHHFRRHHSRRRRRNRTQSMEQTQARQQRTHTLPRVLSPTKEQHNDAAYIYGYHSSATSLNATTLPHFAPHHTAPEH